ncbi:MAG: PQQ-dependent sugar dehydrogenase [Anaerolineae bacterium]|nr:PQQ-dependent sugar dehydrogenase [Anaerolineae bacterium]
MPVAAQEQHQHKEVTLELIAEGLTAPVDLDVPPDGTGRRFVVDQVGMIWIIDAENNLLEQPFLDIRDRIVELKPEYDERGLLGLAFHPGYASNGRFFVYYSAPLREGAPEGWANTNHLSEFQVSADDANVADPGSERILLQIDEPQTNHNGGDVTFGPDGYLYLPLGDGGGANDEDMGHTEDIGNGQDLTKFLGKILRLDVDNGDPYGIPADNPFVNDENVPDEIWAWGFRNPWRATWDSQTGQYFVSDAGQEVWEEVNIVEGGQNYGWRLREGSHCFSVEHPKHNPFECQTTGVNGEPLQHPIIEHTHRVGLVIVGGYVYRGAALGSDFAGYYIFGDWSKEHGTPAGVLFMAERPPEDMQEPAMWKMSSVKATNTEHGDIGEYLLAFGEDDQGELYVLTSHTEGPTGDTGKVWKIVPAEGHQEESSS